MHCRTRGSSDIEQIHIDAEKIDETFERHVEIFESGRNWWLDYIWKRTKEGYSRRATGTPREIIAVYTQLVKRDSVWEEILVFDPDQPEDGVTLPSGTPTAEIAHFCEMYDAADADGRTLLRQQAETLCHVNADAH